MYSSLGEKPWLTNLGSHTRVRPLGVAVQVEQPKRYGVLVLLQAACQYLENLGGLVICDRITTMINKASPAPLLMGSWSP